MRQKTINNIFEQLKGHLIDKYNGPREIIEQIIDIDFERCRLADSDHYKHNRIYAHVGCEDLRICVTSSIELLDRENLQGIFVHEIGHLIHLNLTDILDHCESLSDEDVELLNNLDDEELIADQIVLTLFGIYIHYDSKKVQWVSLEG